MPLVSGEKSSHPKNSSLRTLILLISYLPLLVAIPLAAGTSANSVPSKTVLLLTVDIKQDDPGQKWVLDALTNYLLTEAGGGHEHREFKDINLFNFSDLCFAIVPQSGPNKEQMLLITGLLPSKGQFKIKYGGDEFQLNVRDRKSAADTQKQLLTFILGLACKIQLDSKPADGIFFNPQGEKKERLSAFYVNDTMAILASNRGLVKSALETKSKGLTSSLSYRETMTLLPKGWDAYGYTNSKILALEKTAAKNKRGWQPLLLTLLDGVKSLGFALDVQDKNHGRLTLILIPDAPGDVSKLRNRLEPSLTMLIKQFLDKRIKSKIRFEESEKALRISATLDNTVYFWREVFHIKPKRAESGAAAPNSEEHPKKAGGKKLDARKLKKALKPIKFKLDSLPN